MWIIIKSESLIAKPIFCEKLTFFNLGIKNKWEKMLPNNIKDQMNKIFKKDLEYWGYSADE